MQLVYFTLVYLVFSLQGSYCCTLPNTLLNAEWISSHYGSLTINDTAIGPYPIRAFGTKYFECAEQNGTKYILRTTEVIREEFRKIQFYTCWDLHHVTNDKYIMYIQTTENLKLFKERMVIVDTSSPSPSFADICNAQKPSHEYDVLIRKSTNGKQPCPSWISGHFNYNNSVTLAAGCTDPIATTCTDNSVIMSDLTACPKDVINANGGQSAELYCVHDLTKGTVNYLTVYDGIDMFYCLITEITGTTVEMLWNVASCPLWDTPSNFTGFNLRSLDLIAPCHVPSTSPTTTKKSSSQKSSSHRAALGGLLTFFILITALNQAF